MTIHTTTITVDSAHYAPMDDCLSEAAVEARMLLGLEEGWRLDPRWADDDREVIALTIPNWAVEAAVAAEIYTPEVVEYEWVLGSDEIDPSATIDGDDDARNAVYHRFCEAAEEYLDAHEGPALSIRVRLARRGELAGIYSERRGQTQILVEGGPDQVRSLTDAAYEAAWAELSTQLQAADESDAPTPTPSLNGDSWASAGDRARAIIDALTLTPGALISPWSDAEMGEIECGEDVAAEIRRQLPRGWTAETYDDGLVLDTLPAHELLELFAPHGDPAEGVTVDQDWDAGTTTIAVDDTVFVLTGHYVTVG